MQEDRTDLAPYLSVALGLVGGAGHIIAVLLESPLSLGGPILSLAGLMLGYRSLRRSQRPVARRVSQAGIILSAIGLIVALPTLIFFVTSEIFGMR